MHVVVSDVPSFFSFFSALPRTKRLLKVKSVEWWALHTVEEGIDSNVAVGGHLDQF